MNTPIRVLDRASVGETTLTTPASLVQGLMLIPLLIGGYMSSTLLMAATGKAAGRWRAAQLAGFAVVAGLAVDLIVCYWLQGFPSSKFWIVWPICSLVIAVVAFVAAVLQKLIGAAGTLLTVIVMILLGNPSSGGATGVPYLPTFWQHLGPYLPPRNAYILLHHTIYFNGHGTTEALTVLLIYLVVRRGDPRRARLVPLRAPGARRRHRGRGHGCPYRSRAMSTPAAAMPDSYPVRWIGRLAIVPQHVGGFNAGQIREELPRVITGSADRRGTTGASEPPKAHEREAGEPGADGNAW
ncbi:MAG: hypothetical protein ACLPKE_21180 [Streptosporangiaceae bacterium]